MLKAIKEVELDYQMRKIAERDYREMVERYRTRAMRLMSEIEAGDDFRPLIERELTMRLKLEAGKPVAAPARRWRNQKLRHRRPPPPVNFHLRCLRDRQRRRRQVLQKMRREALLKPDRPGGDLAPLRRPRAPNP